MREILFRGKRKDNGKWVEGFFVKRIEPLTLIPKCYILVQEEDTSGITGEPTGHLNTEFSWYEVIPETFGQYTGLKDKNGKRIFEGDICQHEKTRRTISVSWHGTMAGYVWSKRIEDSNLFDFGELFRVHDKYAVIGNIHDNPELLEVR